MKVALVTGSRRLGIPGRGLVFDMLNEYNPDMVIHGRCPSGADLYAQHWCSLTRTFELPMPAQWTKHGKGAGMERNRYMARMARDMQECGHTVRCFAFPLGESPGTWDCMRQANKWGIDVYDNGVLQEEED